MECTLINQAIVPNGNGSLPISAISSAFDSSVDTSKHVISPNTNA